MMRIVLTTDMRAELQVLRHDPSFSPGERDRVEMLFLSTEGWSVPKIASHLGYHPKTVSLVLEGFLADGTGSLRHHPPGPAPNLERKERITKTMDSLLGQERTWTAAQLADATGPTPGIYWVSKPKSFLAEEFVRFLHALPVVPMPRVVVIDNGSLHKNATVRAAMSELWKHRIYLLYLPPYSPELNDIEPVFRQLKHNEMPERSYVSIADLKDAVDHGLTNMEEVLIAKCQPQPKVAA